MSEHCCRAEGPVFCKGNPSSESHFHDVSLHCPGPRGSHSIDCSALFAPASALTWEKKGAEVLSKNL